MSVVSCGQVGERSDAVDIGAETAEGLSHQNLWPKPR